MLVSGSLFLYIYLAALTKSNQRNMKGLTDKLIFERRCDGLETTEQLSILLCGILQVFATALNGMYITKALLDGLSLEALKGGQCLRSSFG